MAQKITHKFTMPDGTVVKRESATRRYTHVILKQVTQKLHDRMIARAEKDLEAWKAEAGQSDAFYEAKHAKSVESYTRYGRPVPDYVANKTVAYYRECAATSVENAKARLETTRKHYAVGRWECEGWSQSAKSAQSRASTLRGKYDYHAEVHEVTDITEREVKKSAGPRTSGKLTKAQKALLDHVTSRGDEGARLHDDPKHQGYRKTHKLKVAEVLIARDLIEAREVTVPREYRKMVDGVWTTFHKEGEFVQQTRYYLKGQS
jgi:hypothetical protein